MTRLLILKTAALGDVLRTTSILPGLAARYPDLKVTWLTAPGAVPLVAQHPLVDQVYPLDCSDETALAQARAALGDVHWQRVLSFDDEEPLCALASALRTDELSGAYLDPDGARTYTDDVAPWFEMGLLSKQGKDAADRLKIANERTHPEIFAAMLGVEPGRPELPLTSEAESFGARFRARHELEGALVVGLNTGAGGRWKTKELPVKRVLTFCELVACETRDRDVVFVVLGGASEAQRNAQLVAGISAIAGCRVVDGGTDNGLLDFAAIVSQCDVLLTSDSLALHVGVARGVRIVSFFAPTSAAEIELYGLGEKVRSTAPDYCTYTKHASNESITPERLFAAFLRLEV